MPFPTPDRPTFAACAVTAMLCAAAAAAAANPDTGLDEVVVTAQKRIQDVQEIGVAITALGGADLQALRIRQPQELSAAAASLSTLNATSDATPLFLVRGIGLDDFNTNNSSGVGIYLDEVYASLPGFLTQALFDIERVEVLKGPQGTLYGENTAGGAVNIISRRPTANFEGFVDVDFSRWETTDITAAVSGPLTGSVNARLAATSTTQGEGYQRDIDTGRTYGKLERGGARALFDVRPGEGASLLLNLHYAYDHSVPSSPSTPDVEDLVPAGLPFRTAGLLDSPRGGTLVRTGGLPLFRNETQEGGAATLKLRFGGLALTSISAFDDFFSRSLDNYDGYPAADNNWTKHFQQQQLSEELRLTPTSGGIVDWILGAAYMQNRYHDRDALDWTFVYGLADSITRGGRAITAANIIQSQRSAGLYGHAETHLSARWTLVTGLRYSQDEVSFNGQTIDPTGLLSYAARGFTGRIEPGTVLAALGQSRSSRDLTWRIEPDYHVTDRFMVYASASTAYKAGIYYGQPAQVQVDWGYVKPEHVLTTETGIKGRFLGDSLEVDAALFDSRLHDRQSSLSLWAGPVGTQPLIAGLGTVPRSRIDGAESDVEWRPVGGLEIRLGATWLHARVTGTLTNDNGLALFTPVTAGQMLPDAPNFSGHCVIRYERATGIGLRAYAQANDRYTGAEHPYLADPTTFGPGHSVGARIGVKDAVRRWDASLWVTNLTDARPLTYAFAGSEGQRVSFYAKPRSLGVSIDYAF